MRMFLPIKGPGGRNLTGREKVALAVLGCTLIVCLLTLMAGDRAYLLGPSQNPILGIVSVPSRLLGGGIVALYAVILFWSALVYLRGEQTLDGSSTSGRAVAALGITIGLSGVMGCAQLETAGSLGHLVGGSIRSTLGGTVGIPVLVLLVLVGLSVAAEGAWGALRAPVPQTAAAESRPAGPAAPPAGTLFVEGMPPPKGRGVGEPPLPDDGDPSREARSLAVTRAVEEIERSPGVKIVEIEPGVTRPGVAQPAAVPSAAAPPAAAPPAAGDRGGDPADPDAAETDEPAEAAEPEDDEEDPVPETRPDGDEAAPDDDPGERLVAADDSNDGIEGDPPRSYDWRGRPIP